MRAPDPLDRAGELCRRHLAVRLPAEVEAYPLATAAAAAPPPVRPLLCIALSIGNRAPDANDGGDVQHAGQLLDGGDLNLNVDVGPPGLPPAVSAFASPTPGRFIVRSRSRSQATSARTFSTTTDGHDGDYRLGLLARPPITAKKHHDEQVERRGAKIEV